jgi:hypothetical protein
VGMLNTPEKTVKVIRIFYRINPGIYKQVCDRTQSRTKDRPYGKRHI